MKHKWTWSRWSLVSVNHGHGPFEGQQSEGVNSVNLGQV
jgi:hypothetical protein